MPVPDPSRLEQPFNNKEGAELITIGNLLVLARKELDAREIYGPDFAALDALEYTMEEMREITHPKVKSFYSPVGMTRATATAAREYGKSVGKVSHENIRKWVLELASDTHLLDAKDFLHFYKTLDFLFLDEKITALFYKDYSKTPQFTAAFSRVRYMTYERVYSIAQQGVRVSETAEVSQHNFRGYLAYKERIRTERQEDKAKYNPPALWVITPETSEMDKGLYDYLAFYREEFVRLARNQDFEAYYQSLVRAYEVPGSPISTEMDDYVIQLAQAFEGARGYFQLGKFMAGSALGEGEVFSPQAVQVYREHLNMHIAFLRSLPISPRRILLKYGEYNVMDTEGIEEFVQNSRVVQTIKEELEGVREG
jgi:hypothetical protein